MSIFIRRSFGVLAFALLVTACQSDEQKLAEHRSRGDAYFEEGEFGEAIIEYRSILQIDPNDSAAHYKLSKSYFKDKKLKEGFWELRETVRLDPENIDAKLEIAQLLYFGKELDEALANVDAVIAAEPDRVEAYLVRGQVLDGLKRSDEALESFKKAIDIDPDSWDAMNQYAVAIERSGARDEAEKWMVRLTEKVPEVRSYFAYARFLLRGRDKARHPDVIAVFKKAIEVATPEELPQTYLSLANFLHSRNQVDEALRTLEEGIERCDEKLDLIYALARYQALQGNNEAADALIERAAASAPDEAGPLLILSAFRDRQGDSDGALEAAQRAVQVEPDNVDAQLRVAEVLIEIGVKKKQDDVIADGSNRVEALLQGKQAENPAALVIKAKIDLYYRKADEAIAGLRSAITARPEWGQPHFVLGTALAMKGDNTAARSELARALELDPSLLQARRVLAQVHAGLRENEYAVEEGRRYLLERPDDKQVRILVAQSLIRLGEAEAAERELAMIPEDQRNAEVNYAYGRINMGNRNYDAAREFLLAALEELPTNYDILNSLYLIEAERGESAQSASRIAAALEAEPDNARLHLLQGNVALRERRGEDAEASFKKAIELEPQDLTAYEHLARYYATTARLQEAIDTYEAAVVSRPEAAQIFHLLGVLYELGGKREKAIENYEKAIRLAPNLGEAKNNLAYLFADSGKNLDRALELAQEAKALLPDSTNAADTLGWVLFKRGVPGAAIAYLKEAEAGLEPESASLGIVRYHLAQAYASNGDKEQAAATLERALAEVERQIEESRKQGLTADEPDWAAEARALLARLQSS